jgi:hypothetical protein
MCGGSHGALLGFTQWHGHHRRDQGDTANTREQQGIGKLYTVVMVDDDAS